MTARVVRDGRRACVADTRRDGRAGRGTAAERRLQALLASDVHQPWALDPNVTDTVPHWVESDTD